MENGRSQIRLAAVQAASVFLDRDACVAKACELIREAGQHGADVVAFPEGFIPAHPVWFHFHPATSPASLGLNVELAKNAVRVPGPEIDAIAAAAASAGAHVVIGVCEQADTMGTLYNTQVFVGPDGTYLGKHQKLMPTVGERLVHALGSAETLGCVDTGFGPMSGLICGENWNPLALFTLMAGQARVHVMSWPQHFTPGQRPMRERVLIVSQSAAHMMSAFVVSACSVIDAEAYDKMEVPAEERFPLHDDTRHGGSVIVAPDCSILAGPAGGEETIVYGDVDLESCLRGKLHRDLTGHYNRADVFQLRVNATAPKLLTRDEPQRPPDTEADSLTTTSSQI